jgi:hypothetical protein
MTTERDELQKVIFGYFGPTYAINAYRTPEQQDRELVEAILAAGYRKRRTIHATVSTDVLPFGAVIRTPQGYAMEKLSDGWYRAGVDYAYTPNSKWFPATVLYEPEAQK